MRKGSYCDRCADSPLFALPSALCRIRARFWPFSEASSFSHADFGTILEQRARWGQYPWRGLLAPSYRASATPRRTPWIDVVVPTWESSAVVLDPDGRPLVDSRPVSHPLIIFCIFIKNILLTQSRSSLTNFLFICYNFRISDINIA